MYIDTAVNIVYDANLTRSSPADIKRQVETAILEYQTTYLNDFNKTLRQSKLAAYLDTLDGSIVSSTITAKPIIEYIPALNIASSPSFSFEDALASPYAFDATTGFTAFTPAVSTTKFTVEGTLVTMQDDGLGNFMLVTADTEVARVFKSNVGMINYTTGSVKLSNITVKSFEGDAIKFTAYNINNDVKTPKDRIITIRSRDITVTVTPLAA